MYPDPFTFSALVRVMHEENVQSALRHAGMAQEAGPVAQPAVSMWRRLSAALKSGLAGHARQPVEHRNA